MLEAEIAKNSRQRRSPALALAFDAQQRDALRVEARAAAWLVGILYILFVATDVILIRDVVVYGAVVRVFVGLSYPLFIGEQIRRGVSSRLVELQCALGVVIGYVAWLGVTSFSAQTENILYYGSYGIVFMLVANLFFTLRVPLALITSGSITLIFFLFNIFHLNASFAYLASIGSLYILSLVLTMFINWKLNGERYRVFLNALSAEHRHTQARERGEELLRLSKTDALTGLANRRSTDETLQELWSGWTEGQRPFGVILIDIDYFKMFNDFYGHQRGDDCLVTVTRAMEGVVAAQGGCIGRFGGEEFIVLLSATSADHLLTVAEEVRKTVQDLGLPHAARSDHLSVVSVSVGAAFSPDVVGEIAERIVTDADRALYWAKDSNRNCVRLFDAKLVEVESTGERIVEQIRSAIPQGRVELVYQPIWDVASGRLLGAEALMRLTSQSGSPISPTAFIPVAEKCGAIVELGDWALRAACRRLAENEALPVVSVNVSAVQIRRPNFVASVNAILVASGVRAGRLAVEITEGSEIDADPQIVAAINGLVGLGVKVWLDDFGTGFAGLSCLSRIRFDTVKVDRLFVKSSDTARGSKLLRDIVRLVGNSGHKIIVEGVEEKEQVGLLESMGVHLLQGYYFNRPMSADALDQLVRKSDAPPVTSVAA